MNNNNNNNNTIAGQVDKDKGDGIQPGIMTPIMAKTYDGGSTSTSRDNTTDTDDSNRSTTIHGQEIIGRRRTRLSTEQHVQFWTIST